MDNQAHAQESKVALLLVDVISHFEFPDGDATLEHAMLIRDNLVRLKERARRAGVPVIYVNDNCGDWRSERSALIDYCVRPGAKSASFVQALRPSPEDYFVLKPMHSAFYQTPLETLLQQLNVTSLILAGLATNSCITCTAHDANMRRFELFVPRDCSASRTAREHEQAIEHIGAMVKADTAESSKLRLAELMGDAERGRQVK